MIRTLCVTTDGRVILDQPLTSVNDSNIRWHWVDFSNPSQEEEKMLETFFHFHPLAIEDCLHKLQRPKLDFYDDYVFFVTHKIESLDKDIEEINFFAADQFLVSFHYKESPEVNDVWDRAAHYHDPAKITPYLTFYHILDRLVDGYFPVMTEIEDALNIIDDNTDKMPISKLLEHLFDIRGQLLKFRHSVYPMRDLLYRMMNSHRLEWVKQQTQYFSDIYDHLLKLSEMIESNREMTMDIRDSYLSINTNQTNNIMKILTVITTIFMPLTFIAGIYGMNFANMPELQWQYGYFYALGLMSIIGVSMFIWFKKKGWFD